jgi:hypothetical protein
MAATLSQLRTRVRRMADMEDSGFVSDSELNDYINSSYAELYDLLVSSNSEYFLSSATSTVASGSSTITLPSDFYKLRAVDFYLNGRWCDIEQFSMNERNQDSTLYSSMGVEVRYRLQGSTLKLIPSDNAGGQYQIWYTPLPATLSADSDEIEEGNGWSEYVVVDAAIKCLQKEESSTTDLEKAKAQLGKRVADMAAKRDSAKPKQITNINAPFKYSSYSRLRR